MPSSLIRQKMMEVQKSAPKKGIVEKIKQALSPTSMKKAPKKMK